MIRRAVPALKGLANPAWSVIEYGSYPLILLIATPWFLHHLGADRYGFWMLLNAVVGIGSILNIGTGAATIKGVAAGNGSGSNDAATNAVRASLMFALLGGGAIALMVVIGFVMGSADLFPRMDDPASMKTVGYAASFLIILEQVDNVFSSALKGAERFDIAARIEVTSKLALVCVAALVVAKWPTLDALCISLIATNAIRTSMKAIAVRHWIGLKDFRPSLSNASDILHFAKWGWAQGAGGVLFGVADRLIIAAQLGATSLSYYSIASQIAMQIHAVSAAALSVIFPATTRNLAVDRSYPIRKVFKKSLVANILLTSALALAALAFCRFGLPIWLPSAQARPVAELAPYLVLAYWILGLNVSTHFFLLSMGEIKPVALCNLAAGVLFILALPASAAWAGLTGIAVARSFYGIVISINMFVLIGKLRKWERA